MDYRFYFLFKIQNCTVVIYTEIIYIIGFIVTKLKLRIPHFKKPHFSVNPSLNSIVNMYRICLVIGILKGYLFVFVLGIYLSILISKFNIIWAIIFGLLFFSSFLIISSLYILKKNRKVNEEKPKEIENELQRRAGGSASTTWFNRD